MDKKKLNVNQKKEERSLEDIMRLKWALDKLLQELTPEERERLEEVLRAKGLSQLQKDTNQEDS